MTAIKAHPCAHPQSATVRVKRGLGDGADFLTYSIYGVDTDPFVLSQKVNNPDASIFNDLGSGPLYGSYFLPTSFAGSGATFTLSLNSTALNAIAAAKAKGDMFFSIGGSIVPQPLEGEVFLMGQTGHMAGSPIAARLTVNWPFICRRQPPA